MKLNNMRYTDLELFSRKHIINPYRSYMVAIKLGDWCGHSHNCDCGSEYNDMSLEELVKYIKEHKESSWWKCVEGRLSKIDYTFPPYIKHELVDLLKEIK